MQCIAMSCNMSAFFVQLGLNKADLLKSSSIPIFKVAKQSIYMQEKGLMTG
jgi:hypothetical protein